MAKPNISAAQNYGGEAALCHPPPANGFLKTNPYLNCESTALLFAACAQLRLRPLPVGLVAVAEHAQRSRQIFVCLGIALVGVKYF